MKIAMMKIYELKKNFDSIPIQKKTNEKINILLKKIYDIWNKIFM